MTTTVAQPSSSLTNERVGVEDRLDIVDFYARQMHALDGLDIDRYAESFTIDCVVEHAHRNERTTSRAEMLGHIHRALPRYQHVAVRHWFDHLVIDPVVDGWTVRYYSLVSRTDATGVVAFEPTFTITDHLVRDDSGHIRTRSRLIEQDRPPAAGAPASV